MSWNDRTIIEAASWRLASELVRRHPTTTRLIRTHPGGGQYDCLTILATTEGHNGTIQLNRHGTIQVHQRFDGDRRSPWSPTTWDEYLADDPLRFLTRLESAAGLPTPSSAPSTTPTTLTYRVLAAITATAFKTVHPIEIAAGYIDTADHGGGPNELLQAFPYLPPSLTAPLPGDFLGQPGYRFWIVVRDHEPILAIEQSRALWTTRHYAATSSMMDVYMGSKSNLVVTALELLKAADGV